MDRTLTTLIACALLAGCAITPTQKKFAGIVAGVLVVGAIAAERSDNGADQRRVPTPSVDCQPNPELCR